jgi:Putative ER transporter, 6TM, N-terminal/Fusaric acid resistance protein-like
VGIQSAINFGCALFIWPHTVSWKYLNSLNSVLDQIKEGIAEQSTLLSVSPMNLNEWGKYKIIQEKVQKGKAIFVGMIPMEHFLTKEIAYCRFSGKEVKDLKGKVRELLSGLGGFHYWYFLVEAKITIHIQSRPSTPMDTPRASQVSLDVNELTESSLPRSHSKSHIHLPQLAALNKHYEPVGVLESQAYSDLEAGTQTSLNEKPTHFEDMVLLVNETCCDLLKECVTGMDALHKWFQSVNSDRIYGRFFHRHARINERRECTVLLEQAIESLSREIEAFRNDKRFKVLEPHLKCFQSEKNSRQPSYRLLFSSFFYQFHLLEFSTSLHCLLVELHEHDVRQPLPKWWIPGIVEISKWLTRGGESSQSQGPHMDLAADDIDPEVMPQTNSEDEQPLLIQKRNPDAAPPTNVGHLIGRVVVKSLKLVMRPDIFFAIKAGIITVLTATMQWAPSTAAFWYENRGIWVVIMCALTISQFTADTIFGFVCRISGTFFGALLGMVIWYMGSGSGTGNPYALLAILGVLLPFIMFVRNNFV